MMNSYGCSPAFKYEIYSSSNPKLPVELEYIKGWLHIEDSGSRGSYEQVIFNRPLGKEKVLMTPSMVITAKNSSKAGINPATIEAYADELVIKRMNFKDMKVISRKQINLAGKMAIDLALSYGKPVNLLSTTPGRANVKERVVILKQGDKFYILQYESVANEFNKFSGAFSHMIKTLKFK